MKFKMAHQRTRHTVPSGEQYKQDYIMQYDRNGHKYLKPNGLIDLQEKIQKDLESVKLQNIIARCVDPMELVAKNKGVIDVTKMPNTLMEAQNLIINATNYFDSLPARIKQLYDNSAERFIADGGPDGQIWASMAKQQQPTEIKKEETAE